MTKKKIEECNFLQSNMDNQSNYWGRVDIIKLIQLDEFLTIEEIEDVSDYLRKEIWYRVLNEEIPALIISEEDKKKYLDMTKGKDLHECMEHVNKNHPDIYIDELLRKVSGEVKKELAEKYINRKKF